MCGFNFSVAFYCDSHLLRLFPRACTFTFDEHGSDSFTGVRPLVVPLDGKLRLFSARSPLH